MNRQSELELLITQLKQEGYEIMNVEVIDGDLVEITVNNNINIRFYYAKDKWHFRSW